MRDQHTVSDALTFLDTAYATRTTDLKKSIRLGRKALSIAQNAKDTGLVIQCLNRLSLFYMITGSQKQALRHARHAIRLCEQTGNRKGIAEAHYNIGSVYYKSNNFDQGLKHLLASLRLYRELNDSIQIARVQKSLGTVYEYIGDQRNAGKAYEEAVRIGKRKNDLNLISNAYNPLSGIYLKKGNIKKAAQLINEAIEMKTQTGDTRGMAFSIYGRAKVCMAQGIYDRAQSDLLLALSMHREAGDKLGTGMALYRLGMLFKQQGDPVQAERHFSEALELSRKYTMAFIGFKSNYQLYLLHKAGGDRLAAMSYLEAYLEQKEQVISTQTLKIIEQYELIFREEAIQKKLQSEREKAAIIIKKDRAEQLARVKQDFLSTMSHEIRTPLNAVTSIATLLRGRADQDNGQLLDALDFASSSLLMLVNNILDFTRLEEQKVILHEKPVDLTRLTRQLYQTYLKMAEEKGLHLQLDVQGIDGLAFLTDEIRLHQVLANLLGNAIKYTDTGRISLHVSRKPVDDVFDELSFSVKDTGVGIAPENQEAIFENFYQPPSVTTRPQGGSGLGLAIVKKLLGVFGTEIHLRSARGKGSVFSFSLRLKRVAAPVSTADGQAYHLQGKKVLLAEDNMINAMVAMKLLSRQGIICEHAANGNEAVEKAASLQFDYILMDIHMPQMNGFDAAKEIRSQKKLNKETPIFALTADVTAKHEKDYQQYFAGFLAKPIQVDHIFQAMEDYTD
ncbi:tetratricopeptide repeat protein [Pedobacter sp. SYP-B3415]|uniref:tetratricopeptide repeat protein n=1 Tax=Pedobacter sp. SYP-B3415 TaxID=2496641 RepID=UPI00101CCBBD|nr:tetratricopeptide repeat protein [Pedobacter sp. SYP-B3415]